MPSLDLDRLGYEGIKESFVLSHNLTGKLKSGSGDWSIAAGTPVRVTQRNKNGTLWIRSERGKRHETPTLVIEEDALQKATSEQVEEQADHVWVVVDQHKHVVAVYSEEKLAKAHIKRSTKANLGCFRWFVISD